MSRKLLFALAFAVAAAGARAGEEAKALGDAELAGHFEAGPGKKARAELDAGRPGRALALLPAKPKDVPGRWLRALALRAAKRNAEARKDFEALAAAKGPLRDRALFLGGMAAAEAGEGEAAIRLLRQVAETSIDAGEAYLEAARLIGGREGPEDAAEMIEDVLAPLSAGRVRGDAAAANVMIGDALLAAGDRDGARERFRAAWLDFPLSPGSAAGRERARRLGGAAVAPERLVRRAEALLEAGRARQAAAELGSIRLPSLCAFGCPGDKSPAGLIRAALEVLAPGALPQQRQPTPEDVARGPTNPADPLLCRAKLLQGRAWRKTREFSRARTVLAAVVLRCQDEGVRARALFVLAQIGHITGTPRAEPLWLSLGNGFPGSPVADDALYLAAMARRREGDVEGQRRVLLRLVAEHAQGDLAPQALFQLFWSHFAQGKPRDGVEWLDRLAERLDPDGADQERARYWRARALLEPEEGETLEERSEATQAALEDLIWLARERPVTYHGLLARSRLAEVAAEHEQAIEAEEAGKVTKTARARATPLHPGPLARDPHLLAAVELLRLGQRPDAVREILAIDRAALREAGSRAWEALTLMAELLHRAGDFRAAHAVVRNDLGALLRHPQQPLAVRAALLAYPLAFRPHVTAASERAAVPADLLQALMREESGLEPRAVSPAGALGLTQVMPATAHEVAKRIKLHGFATHMLFEPAVNIRIGAAYFGRLYAHLKNPALALAAYNAGPGNVALWVKSFGELPLDAFVEEIPLGETRGYVKRCLRSFAAYRYLYGTGPSRVPRVAQELAAN